MPIDPQRRRALALLPTLLPALYGLALPARTLGAPALKLPELPMTQRLLANGLQFIALPDAGSATVSVQVWYHVGGKDDPAGRSGFAHLFEHLMFKSTKYMQSEQFDRLTEDVGGENNAFTAEDTTAYYCVVPANHLERLLWAEAERMAHLNVDEANFKSERAVVEEELRQRVLADPYGRLTNAIAPNGFEQHPYKRPVIGSIEDLDAATLDDVRNFHSTYYRPDNATLIVSGRFDAERLDAWVDRYFGDIPRPAPPVPRVTVKEPRHTQSRDVALTGPNVPLPAAMLIWQGPNAAHADVPALQVAQALLSAGDSSRLNESLVYRQQIAQSAGFEASLYADAGLLVATAVAAGQRTPQSLVPPLLAEIARLANGPIAPAELDKVKAQLLTAALTSRQTPLGRAMSVGWAVVLRDDPASVNRELDALQAVTAADVQRVLRTYITAGRNGAPRVTLHYTQQAEGAKS